MSMPTGEHCWKKNSGASWARTSNLWIPSLTRSPLRYLGRYVKWDLNTVLIKRWLRCSVFSLPTYRPSASLCLHVTRNTDWGTHWVNCVDAAFRLPIIVCIFAVFIFRLWNNIHVFLLQWQRVASDLSNEKRKHCSIVGHELQNVRRRTLFESFAFEHSTAIDFISLKSQSCRTFERFKIADED